MQLLSAIPPQTSDLPVWGGNASGGDAMEFLALLLNGVQTPNQEQDPSDLTADTGGAGSRTLWTAGAGTDTETGERKPESAKKRSGDDAVQTALIDLRFLQQPAVPPPNRFSFGLDKQEPLEPGNREISIPSQPATGSDSPEPPKVDAGERPPLEVLEMPSPPSVPPLGSASGELDTTSPAAATEVAPQGSSGEPRIIAVATNRRQEPSPVAFALQLTPQPPSDHVSSASTTVDPQPGSTLSSALPARPALSRPRQPAIASGRVQDQVLPAMDEPNALPAVPRRLDATRERPDEVQNRVTSASFAQLGPVQKAPGDDNVSVPAAKSSSNDAKVSPLAHNPDLSAARDRQDSGRQDGDGHSSRSRPPSTAGRSRIHETQDAGEKAPEPAFNVATERSVSPAGTVPTQSQSLQAAHPEHPAQSTARATSLHPVLSEAPAPKAIPLRELSLKLPANNDTGVDLHIVDNRGKLHVEVRTADTQLASSLRDNVGELVDKLDRSGYRAEEATHDSPAISATSQSRHSADQGGKGFGSGSESDPMAGQGGGAGQHQQQQGHGRSNRPRWLEEIVRNFDPTGQDKENQD